MKNKIIISIILLSSLVIGTNVLASTSNGTIDTTYHYAWGENIGWVDFSKVTIGDTSLSGSAYSENTGWIDLSTVTNNSEGTLGGYAWGENIGWVDFSKVTINTEGVFRGSAYSENTGWIIFGDTTNKVMTDWRPASTRVVRRSSGGYFRPVAVIPPSNITTPPTTPIITTTIPTITRTLRLNTISNEVRLLQIYLNTHGYTVSNTGAGSLGKETNTFGPKTKQALMKFQKANKLKADGILGPLTKALLK